VATIIEYQNALQRLGRQGLVCNYFNGGAFGFAQGVEAGILGWIAGEDPTIRPEMRANVRPFPPPAEEHLARASVAAWTDQLPGPAWIMPLSHWAFELDFGSKAWLPNLLQSIGIDPHQLAGRSDASPLEFGLEEAPDFEQFVQTLLENLTSSDFMLAFPDHPALCTIHHHKQLWWISSDRALIGRIGGYGPESAV
jgi:hypothetical protein